MVEFSTNLIASGGLVGVFLLMVLENLFPPIPSEVIMPLAGFTAARGQMPILGVILAGTLGSIAGNAVWFEIARAFGTARTRRLVGRYGRWLGLGPEEVGKAEDTLRRNGPLAVFLGRFMPGVRTAISVPAGLVEMPRSVFYLWTALGTAIWTSGLALGGYILEDQFNKVADWAEPIGFAILGAALVGIGWHFWRARRGAAAAARSP
ncbi:MAG: DedA family protein [Acetobacteraceae bacterium]|nr:DedA family protein [Acetobacteraceae bacterium]